jgi:hypothetical protein
MPEDISERVTRNEERIKTLFTKSNKNEGDIDTIKEAMAACQIRQIQAIESIEGKILSWQNHEKHQLERKIEDAKNVNREPLSRSDWVKILIAIISVSGTIIGIVLQAVL